MATVLSTPELSVAPQNLKRWTVDDYHWLSELGLLNSNERTELIAGQIVVMAAKGIPHVTALRLLARQLDDFLRDRPFLVITQDPIQLDDLSEPEPDLAIVQGNDLTYADHHPTPKEVCLVVEIADSTLKQDCEIKDKAYARANIFEYWVVDILHQRLHIFQSPTQQGYSSHLILTQPSQVSPLAFPDAIISLESIFSPKP